MAVGDDILAMKKAVRETPAVERTDCPICAWPLEEHPTGIKHCQFCGWSDAIKPIRGIIE